VANRFIVDEAASQIVEFALSLPLLVLFVVGIFDFSNAISLKQKLTNATREAARVAAADPANDLGGSASIPTSVSDAFWVVDNYLVSEKMGDCGLKGLPPSKSPNTLTWVSSVNTSAPCGATSPLILTINRACIMQTTINGTVKLVATCVSLQYPYTWQFGGVSGLVGGRFFGPTNITVTATAYNEN
jgi:Flp pilus assembly protein TadG